MIAIELFHIESNSEVTKHGGGKTIELLCNMPIYNVLHGTITLQWVCGAIQCMNTAVSCVIQSSMLPVFIIHDLMHRKSIALSSPCLTDSPFEPFRKSSIFCVPFQSFGNLYIVQPCNIIVWNIQHINIHVIYLIFNKKHLHIMTSLNK